jgi:protein-disulfide isomerase
MSKPVLWSAGALLVLVGGIGGFFVARGGGTPAPQHPQATPERLQDPLLAARTKGSPSAPVTMLEIADFQCPACRLFWAETMPALQHEYVDAGKVKVTFVNMPLVELHKNAAAAAEFAMCAAVQNHFWAVHDMLYDQQSVWAPLADPSAYFLSVAQAVGLNRDSLDACLASGQVRSLIQREAENAFQAGVRSTPSLVIEGGLLAGAVPIGALRPILDSIYAAKTGSR